MNCPLLKESIVTWVRRPRCKPKHFVNCPDASKVLNVLDKCCALLLRRSESFHKSDHNDAIGSTCSISNHESFCEGHSLGLFNKHMHNSVQALLGKFCMLFWRDTDKHSIKVTDCKHRCARLMCVLRTYMVGCKFCTSH